MSWNGKSIFNSNLVDRSTINTHPLRSIIFRYQKGRNGTRTFTLLNKPFVKKIINLSFKFLMLIRTHSIGKFVGQNRTWYEVYLMFNILIGGKPSGISSSTTSIMKDPDPD